MRLLALITASTLLISTALAAELDSSTTEHIHAATVRIDASGARTEASFSGVVVDASGLVLTSAHALGCVDEVVVTTATDHALDARVILLDDEADLAVLAVRPKRAAKLRALEPGIPPGPGATVHAWGQASSLRSGQVRRVEGGTLQVQMPTLSTDIGGPVVDGQGHLVGLITGWQPGRAADDPLSLAVGARKIGTIIEDTNPDGRVSKKTLCAGARKVWEELRSATDHLEQGDLEAAETLLGLALGRQLPDSMQVELRLMRAQVRTAGRDLESAIIDLTTALELQPDQPDALVARGLARNEVGRHEAALRDLDEAIQHLPHDLRAWSTRAEILYDMDRKPEAEEAIRSWATAGGRAAEGLGLLCRLHLDRAGYDEANSSCRAALASGWNDPRAFLDRARQLRERGDLGGALKTLDAGLDGGLQEPATRYERALLRLHFDRAEGALADAVVLTEASPDHAAAWYAQAYALGRLGRPAEAIAAAKKAAELGHDGAEEMVHFLKAGAQPARLELQ